MGRPFRPNKEFESGSPLDLDRSLELVVLAATERPEVYEAWAAKWLARWLLERDNVTVERATDIAGALADLRTEPKAADAIRAVL